MIPNQGPLTCPGDVWQYLETLEMHSWVWGGGVGNATVVQGVEAEDATDHPTAYRTALTATPHTREDH